MLLIVTSSLCLSSYHHPPSPRLALSIFFRLIHLEEKRRREENWRQLIKSSDGELLTKIYALSRKVRLLSCRFKEVLGQIWIFFWMPKVQITRGPFPSFIFCHLSSRKCNPSRCDLLNPLVSLPLTNQTKFPLKCCNGIILHLNLPSLTNQIRLLWVDMSISLLTMSIIIYLIGVRLSRSCNTIGNIKEIHQWKLAVLATWTFINWKTIFKLKTIKFLTIILMWYFSINHIFQTRKRTIVMRTKNPLNFTCSV